MSRVTPAALTAFAFAFAIAGAPIATRAQTASACAPAGVGDAVGLQLNLNAPIVIGRSGVVARFESLVRPDGRFAAPAEPPHFFCTGIADVVGIAAGIAAFAVADRTSVHEYDVYDGTSRSSFAPALAPNETIAALALLPSGAVELAIVAANDGTGGDKPVAARFAAFAATARGAGATPVRTFSYDGFLGRPSAITIDSKGRIYVYDDGGEVSIFAAGSTGSVKPVRRFAGTDSALRPVARANAGGSRQMALDVLGSLYVADDGAIVTFPFADDGQQSRGDATLYDPQARLRLVRGIATGGSGIELYVLSVDPASDRASINVYPSYKTVPAFEMPVP